MKDLMTMIATQSADLVAGGKTLILLMVAAFWGASWWLAPRWLWLLLAVAVLMIAANIAAGQWFLPLHS